MDDSLGILRIEVGPLGTNCYLLWDPGSLEGIVIDPGWVSDDLIDAIATTGVHLVLIVNTHGHVDHVAGNRRLHEMTGAPLAIHPRDLFLLEHAVHQGRLFGCPCEPSPAPGRFLAEGDVIDVGRFQLKVLETPGHSPGSVSLKGEGFVAVGDALFAGSIGRTDLPGGSFEELIESIQTKLLTFTDDTRVLTGHGPETTVGGERRSNPFL